MKAAALWEEYARVQLTEEARGLRVGDPVHLLPAHVARPSTSPNGS